MGVLHLQLSASKAKQVAQLLSNDTARRLMDAVSESSKSESELAKELNLPLSTVHYNIQKLQESGLLHSDEYTYSEKGKEVRHYKLASEHVLISTKPVTSLATVIGGIVLTGAFAVVTLFSRLPEQAEESTMMAFQAAPESADMMMRAAPELTQQAANPSVWPWVLAGATAMLLGMMLVFLVQRWRE